MSTLTMRIDGLPTLQAGDQIAFYSSSSPYPPKERAQIACEYIAGKCGLRAKYWEDCFIALSPERRAEIFLHALFDQKIKALWAFRGGEGAADIIPFLDRRRSDIAKLTPKLLIGFSDMTVLLLYFAQIFGWPVVHGCNISQIIDNKINDATISITLNLIMGLLNEIKITDLKALNSFTNANRTIKGELIGGNLSLLHCSTKEIWELDSKNKIVFIEDVRERPHVIRRTLNHLQRIGLFNEARAIIFGNFDAEPIGETLEIQYQNKIRLEEVLRNFAEVYDAPVFFTNQVGHGQFNIPIVHKRESFLS